MLWYATTFVVTRLTVRRTQGLTRFPPNLNGRAGGALRLQGVKQLLEGIAAADRRIRELQAAAEAKARAETEDAAAAAASDEPQEASNDDAAPTEGTDGEAVEEGSAE